MSSLIDNLRDTNEREANEDRARTKHLLEILTIALVAIRQAGEAGNVRCNLAMTEILTKDNEYRQNHPTH